MLASRGGKISSHSILCLIPVLTLSFTGYFEDNFTVIKWIFFYTGSFVTLFLSIIGSGTYRFPLLRKSGVVLLSFLSVSTLIAISFNNMSLLPQRILDALAVVSLLFCFYQCFTHDKKAVIKIKWLVLVSSLACALIGFLQVFGLKALTFHLPGVASTFGNTNIAAQFLGVGVISCLTISPKENGRQRIIDLTLFILLVYIVFLNCRSVLIALFLSVAFLFAKRRISMRTSFIFTVSFFVGIFLPFEHPQSSKDTVKFVLDSFSKLKFGYSSIPLSPALPGLENGSIPLSPALPGLENGSTQGRYELLKGTVYMIKDYPFFGTGPGEFEFNFLSYQKKYTNLHVLDSLLYNNPHNEYMRVIAEYGIIFFILLATSFCVLFKGALSREGDSGDKFFISSLIIFFSIEAMFQFPLFNAISYYLILMIVAYMLAKAFPVALVEKRIARSLVVIFLVLPLSVLTVTRSFSLYYEVHHKHYYDLVLACNLFPANWRACIKKAHSEMVQGNFERSKKTIEQILESSPHNFHGKRYLSIIHRIQGDQRKSCSYARSYNDLFNTRRSSLYLYEKEHCSEQEK